jgi:phosphopantothenoylcysteine decarboxylase
MKILLGITGSVATSLTPKLVKMFLERGHEVKVVATEMASQFLEDYQTLPYYTDEHEFYGKREYVHENKYKKDDSILHIELREWADVMLISPCSANTMAKMVAGVCDNLLTSVYRAWDFDKPIFIAPSCNTKMWTHPSTNRQLQTLFEDGVKVIYPTVKKLACGDYGIGALQDLLTIVNMTEGHTWGDPFLGYCEQFVFLPPGHPGAFGTPRHTHVHTGSDCYVSLNTPVFAAEDGEVVSYGQFTGEAVGCGYWNDTWYVSIKGKSGVICYGEIALENITLREKIKVGRKLGYVLEVVKESPKKPVPFHKKSMLHVELLDPTGDIYYTPDWDIGAHRPKEMMDPTPYLYDIFLRKLKEKS